MGLRLPRHLGPATSLPRGQWSSETASGNPAWCCPECGEIDEIELRDIDRQSGRVRYRRACATQRCSFVEFLIFDAYAEEVLT